MKINRIIPFSCVDGPGNRMVIFLQGCNFHCGYCHNPETIHECISCGTCLAACPTGALSMQTGQVHWNATLCCHCDACLQACPNLSSPRTHELSSGQLMKKILRAADFLDGITISGGECTRHPAFLQDLFEQVRSKTRLSCFIDTNGSLDLSQYPDLVACTDGFMLDVKTIDPQEHQRLTGCSNDIVRQNLDFLLAAGKLYEVRTVLAPGLSHEKTIRYVAAKIQDRCIYKLLKYRPLGVRPEGLQQFGRQNTVPAQLDAMLSLARACGASKAAII